LLALASAELLLPMPKLTRVPIFLRQHPATHRAVDKLVDIAFPLPSDRGSCAADAVLPGGCEGPRSGAKVASDPVAPARSDAPPGSGRGFLFWG
jgi:hypothetical protein